MYYTVCKIVKHNKFTHKTGLKILSESQENQALAKEFASAFYFCHANLPSSRETE